MGPKRAAALPLVPGAAASIWNALAHVVHDSSRPCASASLGDVAGLFADHHTELQFPSPTGAEPFGYDRDRPGPGCNWWPFMNTIGSVGMGNAGFGSVVGVVEADGHESCRCRSPGRSGRALTLAACRSWIRAAPAPISLSLARPDVRTMALRSRRLPCSSIRPGFSLPGWAVADEFPCAFFVST